MEDDEGTEIYQKRRAHALERARERHGIELTEEDYDLLVAHIQSTNTLCVDRLSNSRAVHAILYKGIILYPLYVKGGRRFPGLIATFFSPKERYSNYAQKHLHGQYADRES